MPGKEAVFKRQVAPALIGWYTWKDCLVGYRENCMAALRRAEAKKGSPALVNEISKEWNSTIPKQRETLILAGLQELFKCDQILTNTEHTLFTLNPAH